MRKKTTPFHWNTTASVHSENGYSQTHGRRCRYRSSLPLPSTQANISSDCLFRYRRVQSLLGMNRFEPRGYPSDFPPPGTHSHCWSSPDLQVFSQRMGLLGLAKGLFTRKSIGSWGLLLPFGLRLRYCPHDFDPEKVLSSVPIDDNHGALTLVATRGVLGGTSTT